MENKGSQFFLHETSIIDEDVEIGKMQSMALVSYF